MPMSKKHYTAIAHEISIVMWEDGNDPKTVMVLTGRLADLFEDDNPRFDRQRFLTACTKPTNTVLGGPL